MVYYENFKTITVDMSFDISQKLKNWHKKAVLYFKDRFLILDLIN